MHLLLAHLPGSTADRNILQRTAEAAHGMAFEMGQHDHRIIVHDMPAHRHFREMPALAHRQRNIPFLIHDIYRTEIPTIDCECLAMLRCRIAAARIQGIRLNDRALRHMCLESLHHIPRQDIRAMRLARMQLNRDLAINPFIDDVVQPDQMLRINMLRKIYPGTGAAFISLGNIPAADHRRLRKSFAYARNLC